VARRLLLLALGAATAAVVASRLRLTGSDPARNGGRQRTERLRRELADARERLRQDLARAREQS
jgi:hypothetical protein